MNTKLLLFPLSLLSPLCLRTVCAQDGPGMPRATTAADIAVHRAPADLDIVRHRRSDDASWAAGRNWKASFGRDGFTFVPFFGSSAPRNFPVSFRLREVTVGGEPLPIAPEALATADGDRYVLARGPVREVYDLAPDHVAQSFVVEVTAPGDVDLVVAVGTELRELDELAGLQFGNEFGHVAPQCRASASASTAA